MKEKRGKQITMKKKNKFVCALLLSMSTLFGLASCSGEGTSSSAGDPQIQEVYQAYLDNGGNLSYEDWLASIKGEKGDTGTPGKDGTNGKDGSSVLSGKGEPADTLGKDGDSYIDTETFDFYVKADGKWAKSGNIKGEKGDTGAPGSNGNDGKNGSNGVDGKDGSSVLAGKGEPDDALGKDGDTYIDLYSSAIYVKKDGKWVKQDNTESEGEEEKKDDTGETGDDGKEDAAKTITIWVSEAEEVSESFQALAEEYIKNNSLDYNIEVQGVSEHDSAIQMLYDVDDGADIFCFAQDQFLRLVEGGVLSKLGEKATEFVKNSNTEDSVKAVTDNNSIYAYPLTADNGYFMYYNKEYIDESHVDSLEDIIKDCEKAGKNFSFEMESSAWYMASFFFGTGCVSEWTADSKGKFTAVNDTFNSEEGLIAMRGMQHLVKSGCYNSSSMAADLTAAIPSAVLVSGTWAYDDVKDILGDNMGVADLPSFTVDGKSYHLGSYSGYKLMGVKPQKDVKKTAVLHDLAQYLSGEDAQKSRLKTFGWGPSNKAAQDTDDFKNNPALVVLAEQNKYATIQGNVYNEWWDTAKMLGYVARYADLDDTDTLKKGLNQYKYLVDSLLQPNEDMKRAFTVIGHFADTSDLGEYYYAGADDIQWKYDIPMTEDPTNTWTSAAITLTEGDEFKVRQGKSWDVSFGKNGDNYKVSAAEAGKKKIQFVGDENGGTVTLLDAE